MDFRREGPARVPPEELIYSMFYEAFRAGVPEVSPDVEKLLGATLELLEKTRFVRGSTQSFPEFGGWWAVDGAYGTVSSIMGECGVSVAVSVGLDGGALVYDFRPEFFYAGMVDASEVGVRMLLSEMRLAVLKLEEGASGVILDGSAYGFVRRIQAAPKGIRQKAWELFGRLFEASLRGKVVWVPKDVRSKPLMRFLLEDFWASLKVEEQWVQDILKKALPEDVDDLIAAFKEKIESLGGYRETYLAGLILSHRHATDEKFAGQESGYGLLGPVDMLEGGDNEIAKQMRNLLPDGATYAAFYVWLPRWKGWRYAVRVEVVMPKEDTKRPLPSPREGGSVVGDAIKSVIATMDEVPRSGLVLAADESAKVIVGKALELIKRSGLLKGSPRGEGTPSSAAGGV